MIERARKGQADSKSPRPPGFDAELMALMSSLRGYAMSLTKKATAADDLVQDTIVLAMRRHERFQQGTNLKAWTFTLMRNLFLSERRKAGREVADVDGIFSLKVPTSGGQEAHLDLRVVVKRMRFLNSLQRQLIQLVAIERYSYEEAADILGIEIGTAKSGVSRARVFLETGIVDKPVQEMTTPAPEPLGVSAHIEVRIANLFKAGRTVGEIQAELGGISRSDVMRVVIEQKLKRVSA